MDENRSLPQTFVVRVYRQEADDPGRLHGIVEVTSSSAQHAFHCIEELWRILISASQAEQPRASA